MCGFLFLFFLNCHLFIVFFSFTVSSFCTPGWTHCVVLVLSVIYVFSVLCSEHDFLLIYCTLFNSQFGRSSGEKLTLKSEFDWSQ